MPTVKDDRLQVRISPEGKRFLEQAAHAAHLSLSAFVVQAAVARAESMLADRQTIVLSPEAAEAFSVAMERPGEVNDRLAAAWKRTRGFRFLD